MTRLSIASLVAALALIAALPVSAATIPHTPPRQPVAQAIDDSGVPNASALPYVCNRSELATRLKKKVCL